jgi:hypothetical protein
MTDHLRTLLLKSEAVLSLQAENRVLATFQENGWETSQGWFYRDTETGKMRELDILAQQLWRRRSNKNPGITRIRYMVEVKSLTDYHLVFAPTDNIGELSVATRFWLGYRDPGRHRWLRAVLERERFSLDDCSSLVEAFGASLYPSAKKAPRPLGVAPPVASLSSSAFRETNIKGTKDLDASVMWRAAAALRSALQSSFRKSMQVVRELINQAAFFAGADLAKRYEAVRQSLEREALRVVENHPLLVVDAHLWKSESGTLDQIDWCRFIQRDSMGDVVFWCDVVSYQGLAAYLDVCTEHYRANLRRRGAIRFS